MLSSSISQANIQVFVAIAEWSRISLRKTVLQYCFIIFEGQQSFLWGHWYPYFGLLVTSTLGFKARVVLSLAWLIACMQWIPQIHLWCNTCWIFDGQHGSQAILSTNLHTCTQALVELEWAKRIAYPLANMFPGSFQLILLKDSQSHWPDSIIAKGAYLFPYYILPGGNT